ncbi:MAG: protein phosphatase 2C domain-containing protein [Bryobacteraceae bacterium]
MGVAVPHQAAGVSDPGRVRENNEDRFHIDAARGIYLVIDGVGGHAAGERAADTALDLIKERLERATGAIEDRLREAIALANNEIFELAQSNPEWKGMACVLTAAVISAGEVALGQVGDSRCYLIEAGSIRKLTHDHSPVGEREDRGEIDEHSAMRHPRRNEVFRDVGSAEHSPDDPDFIEISRADLLASSALVLCSDGLSDLIASHEILSIVEANAGNPKAAAQALIDAANLAGGKDNVTAIVVEASEFAASVRGRRSAGDKTAHRLTGGALPLALLAVLLTLGAVYLLKPYWKDTENGMQFGYGPVREPRTYRVASDIGGALLRAQPGDTVLVAPGTYSEQMRLRSGIRLIRRSRAALANRGPQSCGRRRRRTDRRIPHLADGGQPLTACA